MAFTINYSAGGIIDEVKNVNIPGVIPEKRIPYTKGFKLDVPALKDIYSIVYVPEVDMELLAVAIACSGYMPEDYWELSVDGVKIMETIYTKELPESNGLGTLLGCAYKVQAGQEVKIDFHNDSGTSKIVWVNLRFLR